MWFCPQLSLASSNKEKKKGKKYNKKKGKKLKKSFFKEKIYDFSRGLPKGNSINKMSSHLRQDNNKMDHNNLLL